MKTILRVIEIIAFSVVILETGADFWVYFATMVFGLASYYEGMLKGEEE